MNKTLIKIVSKALGDTIGAMAAIDSFREKSGNTVSVICNLDGSFFTNSYPDINFLPHDSGSANKTEDGKWFLSGEFYDEYKEIEYLFNKPLIAGYAEQLGVYEWKMPKIDVTSSERPIKSKYVCISIHSTAQCKNWNYPDGWDKLCRMIRKSGYTPVCVDRFESFGSEGSWNPSPKSCVKKHGMDLKEILQYIDHCEFFVGLSSGLAWAANAAGKKTVMICGVASEDNEKLENNIRIVNTSVCHGCINKQEYKFDAGDWFWCPVHKGTPRQFECTTSITPEYVFGKIQPLMTN